MCWKTELKQLPPYRYVSSVVPLTQKLCVTNKLGEGWLPHTFRSQKRACGETFIHLGYRAWVQVGTITLKSQHVSLCWVKRKSVCAGKKSWVVPTQLYVSSVVPLTQNLCFPNKLGEGWLLQILGYHNGACGEVFIHPVYRECVHLETLTMTSQHVP